MITRGDIDLLEQVGKLKCDFNGRRNKPINAPHDYESARKEFYAHLADDPHFVLVIPDPEMVKYVSYGDGKKQVDGTLSRLPRIRSEISK